VADLHFPVEAYDERHEKLLMEGPRAANIRRLLKQGLRTTESAILIHAMFTEQDSERVGFRTHNDLADKAASREAIFRDYVEMSNGAIASRGKQQTVHRGQTERLGCACAVLTMNELLDTTEADWERIEDSALLKTLDFQLKVSDGKAVVGVEAKGTVAENPLLRSSGSTSKMRRDIEDKKVSARATHVPGSNEAYGVITAIGTTLDTPPTIYLLDPPAEGFGGDPGKARLLNRMNYYLRHLALVGQFRMLMALRNRIQAIERLSSYRDLDGVGLTNTGGTLFALPSGFGDPDMHFIGGLVGRILRPTRIRSRVPSSLRFVGFSRRIFQVLTEQSYDQLLEWRRPRQQETVEGRLLVRLDDQSAERTSGSLIANVNAAGIALGWFRPGGSGEER
jgi:hypothetical protein